MPLTIEQQYLTKANFDTCFADWLRRVDQLCQRFLDATFLDLEEDAFEPRDYFDAGMRPEIYFKDVVIPVFELDFGCDFVEELIAENAMWGGEKP